MKTFADFGIDLAGKSGVEVASTCPQCSASRRKKTAKSLSVNTEKGVWNCHHCGWVGSLLTGTDTPARRPKLTVKPTYQRSTLEQDRLYAWFARRGIPPEIVDRHAISLHVVYQPQLEDEVLSIAFPYRTGGEVVNVKYRGLAVKCFRQVAGAAKVFYGVDDVQGETVILVEGELDKLACEVAGITSVLSVPDGAPPPGSKPSDQKFEYLDSVDFSRFTKIVLAVDRDPAGQHLEAELARRLGRDHCWLVRWPEDCKDANEVLVQHGPDVLRHYLDGAVPHPLEDIVEVEALWEDLCALYQTGLKRGLSTGWESVDQLYTVEPGQVTVVTGIPSHGKSEWLDALAVNLAQLHDWHFAVCSPENWPATLHLSKLAEKVSRKPFRIGLTVRMSPGDLRDAWSWLQGHFTFIAPSATVSVPGVLERASALVRRKGIRGLILDPWNEFDHTRPHGMTETEYIGDTLGLLKRWARTHAVHVWVVAHPQKLTRRDDGQYPVPTPYDISGSAHWRNKADNCLAIWRDLLEPARGTDIHVQKVRFKHIGSVGIATLHWRATDGRYDERP